MQSVIPALRVEAGGFSLEGGKQGRCVLAELAVFTGGTAGGKNVWFDFFETGFHIAQTGV